MPAKDEQDRCWQFVGVREHHLDLDLAPAFHRLVHRHFVGCDRACGSPLAGEVLVATGDGYRLL